MILRTRSKRTSSGFSLLEVLVAVVILATGLLALAALQGSLARNSADAKIRSRIAALLSAEMDNLRSGPYVTLADGTTTTTATSPDCSDLATLNAVEVAACDAAVGTLTLTRTVATFGANASASAFVAGAPAGTNKAEFKRITLQAAWTDAANQQRSVSMATALSALALEPNSPLVDEEPENADMGGPVVRQANPVTDGMIPIALGNGDSTAASNPTPELVGKNKNQTMVGTRFNVLTYTPSSSGDQAVIQQRIETEVIKCTCQYGAGGDNLGEIYQTAQWPAVWTGKRYDVYQPDSATEAPGQRRRSGPAPGVTQSALCQECCRDHHDEPSNTTDAKFDPEGTTDAYRKYNWNPTTETFYAVNDTEDGVYIDACRVIRVDGFWRTAADMYNRQFGLLETQTVSGVQAKNGLPTTTATGAYTTFVKDYLEQYDGTSALPPSGADTMFNDETRGLNNPPVVAIASPSNSDYRYLHVRGLYVDHLEKQARDTLAEALASRREQGECQPGGADLADCVLPYLPFTTINLTEIADWEADKAVLAVNTGGNFLSLNPSQPSGGRSYGVGPGASDNTAEIRVSNSGVAVSTMIKGAVALDDTAIASDSQAFTVGGTQQAGDEFTVSITGGGTNPYVFYVIGSDTAECTKPKNGNHRCTTHSTLPQAGSVRIEHYWIELFVTTPTATVLNGVQCTYNGGPVTIANDTIAVPAFRNYAVTSASIGATAGTIGSPSTDGKATETTTVSFASIPVNAVVNIGLTEQSGSPIKATLTACTARRQGNKYVFEAGTWSKPWLQ